MPLDHFVTLGRSGLRVSPFALGAMTFGEDPPGAGTTVEESERILRTYLDRGGNFVDIYWLHAWDRNTPIEETMRTLDDLVRAGKIRYLGFSNVPAWVTARAQTMALLQGWTPLIALQVEYSLLARTVEGEIAPMAQDLGMALVPWSPLRNGFLSGKYRRGADVGDSVRAGLVGQPTDDEYAVIEAVAAVAAEIGTSSAAVALAWLRARDGVVVPIVGARRVGHLESNLAALEIVLTDQHLRTLDEVSTPTLDYPAPMRGALRAMLQFGGTTVDGESSIIYPPLAASDVRY